MPIKFRCGACDQLLGIARRKAGSIVDCPSCGAKTIVPRPQEDGQLPRAPKRTALSLLERVDVDKLLAPAPGRIADSSNRPQRSQKPPLPAEPPAGAPSSPSPSAGVTSGPAESAKPPIPRPPSWALDPAEMQTLSQPPEDDDSDDVPLALDEPEAVAAFWGLTRRQWLVLAVVVLVLTAGSFSAGWWLAQRP